MATSWPRMTPARDEWDPEATMAMMIRAGRLALNKTDAARHLGVSVEFFDEHVAREVRCVRRGRRRLYPTGELVRWLCENAELAGWDA